MGKLIEKVGTRKRVFTINSEPTMTQQQYKDSVNINNIMDRYKKTGSISHLRNVQDGIYADLTQISDYATSLMQIKKAQEAFEVMPSSIRNRFQNDPAQLISFLQDSKNRDEAIKIGLVAPPNEPNPKPNDPPATPPTTPAS